MKHFIYICPIAALLLLASCKKGATITGDIQKTTPPVTDSVAYLVDGGFHTSNVGGITSAGNQQVNVVLDPLDKLTQHGDKDSVQYYRTYSVYGNGATFYISVIKNYSKLQLSQQTSAGILAPANTLDLCALGQHPYAVDFNRENTQNGIAIAISNTGGLKTTYSPFPLNVKTTIPATAQANSTFRITSLTKLPEGRYLMEATFSATIFDSNENPHKLENGYIRVHVD